MEKLCIECGAPFKGRSDKKFCSDYCRNQHNNKLNSCTNNYMRRINSILRRNRRILAEFYGSNRLNLNRNILTWEGYDFRFFTHFSEDEQGLISYYCYDFGYTDVQQGMAVVINKEVEQD